MEQYSIKDLEKLSGINASTIRVWERRYRIIKPSRTDTNRRRYEDAQLRKILNISILHRNGYKISLIASLSDQDLEEKVVFLTKDTSQSEIQIDSLIKLTIEYNEKGFNELLMRSIMGKGFEDTMTEIIFPFFKRVGIKWQTGSLDIGSEHFISNLLRQKIILSIESLPFPTGKGAKKAILFLPENELHELGLLFYNYLLRKSGCETLYLGQSTPIESVRNINERWNPDIMVTGLISVYSDIKPDEYILQLGKSFPKLKILVSGILAEAAENLNLSNIYPLRSSDDLKIHI